LLKTPNEKWASIMTNAMGEARVDAPVSFDESATREFLTILSEHFARATDGINPPGWMQLCAIFPDSKPIVQRFRIGQIDQMVDFAEGYALANHNVYIEGRTVGDIKKGRGSIKDTRWVAGLCIDSDADKGSAGVIPVGATLIVESSGDTGNRHAWFMFDRAILADEAKEIGDLMRKAVGADHDTGTVTQPYRVAGTPNFPGAEKRRLRSRVDSNTRIIEHSRRVWTPDELRELFKTQPKSDDPGSKSDGGANDNGPVEWNGDESELSADLLGLIKNGAPEGERSERFHHVVGQLKRAGASVEQVVALLEKYPAGIAAKYEGRIRPEVERSYDKIKIEEQKSANILANKERPFYINLSEWAQSGSTLLHPGVWYCSVVDKGPDKGAPTHTFICSPCEVIAETVNEDGSAWGRLLRFRRPDGKWVEHSMPMAMLTANGDEWRKELTDRGMLFDSQNRQKFERYVHSVHKLPQSRKTNVQQVGWAGQAFVLPDAVIGPGASDVVFQPNAPVQVNYKCKGSLEGWRTGVAALAVGNATLVFAISCGFVGPLLEKCHAENGGVHVTEGSSKGKTTLAVAAASVSGDPSVDGGQILGWRATSNGLEGAAVIRNDGLMVLDEINQATDHEIGAIVYGLANGQGKQRAGRSGAARASTSWRTFIFSTGERSIVTVMEAAGEMVNAGQIVRMIDIGVKRTHGVWDELHKRANGAAFSKDVKLAASKHHGWPLRAFLGKLTVDKRDFVEHLETFKALQEFDCSNEDGQVARVGERFALIAMAGELATEYGLVPWTEGDAVKASMEMFYSWCSVRAQGNQEPIKIREMVSDCIDKCGADRFSDVHEQTVMSHETAKIVHNRLGWRNTDGNYWFSGAGLREATKGHDFRVVQDVLLECGALIPPPNPNNYVNPRRDVAKRISGRVVKVYVIDPERLDV
jgi:putative DNA primase/helicase